MKYMTVRQLIRKLNDMDEDVKDYNVGVVFRIQLNEDVRISGKATDLVVPENVDVDKKMLWLKVRKEI